ncbi:MAG: hypothetical protein AAF922_07965 [Pseudomonadota bacterium]
MTDQTPKDAVQGAPPFPPITLTEQDWLVFFDEVDATEAEKIEMIQTLWTMMRTFVHITWNCRPAPKTRGQVLELASDLRRAVVQLEAESEDL